MCKTSAPVAMTGELQPLTNLNLEVFKCPDCPEEFRLKTLLRRHVVRSHSRGPHICAQCGHNARNAGELRVHGLTHLGKTFQCPDCLVKFTSHRSLTRHVRSIHGKTAVPEEHSSTMECTACDLKFDSTMSWDTHLALHIAAKARANQSTGPLESDENSPPIKMEDESSNSFPGAMQHQASWDSPAISTPEGAYGTCPESEPNAPFQEHVVPTCGRCGEKFSSAYCLDQHMCMQGTTQHYQPSPANYSSGLYGLSAIHYEQPVAQFNVYDGSFNHYEAPSAQYLSPDVHYEPPAVHFGSPAVHFVSPANSYAPPADNYGTITNHYQESINPQETSSVYTQLSSNNCDLSVNPFDPPVSTYIPEPNLLDPCANSYDSSGSFNELFSDSDPFSTCDSVKTPDNQVDPLLNTFTKSSGKSFICDECQGSFCSKPSLMRHKLTHSKTNNTFQCTECSVSFTSTAQLGRHLRIHGLDKPYKCTECDIRFKTPNNLRKHELTHTKQSSFYTCNKCPSRFTNAVELLLHKQDHVDDRPHECQECHRKFIKVSHLKRHMDTKHPSPQSTSRSVDMRGGVGSDGGVGAVFNGDSAGASAGHCSDLAGDMTRGDDVDDCDTARGDDVGDCDTARGDDVDDCDTARGDDVDDCDIARGDDADDCDIVRGGNVDNGDYSGVKDDENELSASFSCSVCHKVFSKRRTLMRHLFHHLERWQSK